MYVLSCVFVHSGTAVRMHPQTYETQMLQQAWKNWNDIKFHRNSSNNKLYEEHDHQCLVIHLAAAFAKFENRLNNLQYMWISNPINRRRIRLCVGIV